MESVDLIMQKCVDIYEKLPKTGKPNDKEWTVLAAVVGLFHEKIEVLSLGTGSKCIGKNSMSPNGDVINDSHAEVIARRGFLKYLYFEIKKLNEENYSDIFYKSDFKVQLKDDVKFCFVVSATPCGDASIILKNEVIESESNLGYEIKLKSKRDLDEGEDVRTVKKLKKDNTFKEDDDIFRTGAKCLPESDIQDLHLPGINYHTTGVVRTKPGRGDPTASVSCSDKLARWNAVGIQGALLSLLVKQTIFIDFVIVGGGCPFSKESFDRAINLRVKKSPPVPIYQSSVPFPHRKNKERLNPTSASILWCKSDNKTEAAVNGRKQGATKKNFGKKSSRLSICRKDLFILFHETLESFKNIPKDTIFKNDKNFKNLSYEDTKKLARNYQEAWEKIKNKYFKIWTVKPINLMNFTVIES